MRKSHQRCNSTTAELQSSSDTSRNTGTVLRASMTEHFLSVFLLNDGHTRIPTGAQLEEECTNLFTAKINKKYIYFCSVSIYLFRP